MSFSLLSLYKTHAFTTNNKFIIIAIKSQLFISISSSKWFIKLVLWQLPFLPCDKCLLSAITIMSSLDKYILVAVAFFNCVFVIWRGISFLSLTVVPTISVFILSNASARRILVNMCPIKQCDENLQLCNTCKTINP